ncbi:hypothetical protein [Burkholderia pyrrocinia]
MFTCALDREWGKPEKSGRSPAGISPLVQRRKIEAANAVSGESGKSYRMQCGIIATKQIAGLNPIRIQAGDRH